MSAYDTAQICLNGHLISGSLEVYPHLAQHYCSLCGSETISICPECNTPIHGYYNFEGIFEVDAHDVPAYCHNCGKPYPWTQKALESAALILEESELGEEQIQNMIQVLPDLVTENPGTNLAVLRLKKIFASGGRLITDALRQFVIDYCCDLAKKQLGL